MIPIFLYDRLAGLIELDAEEDVPLSTGAGVGGGVAAVRAGFQ